VEYVHLSFPNDQTAYVQIQLFGNGVDKAFSTAMKALSGNTNIQKLIIDLRDNPGGSLEGVTNMLSYFVPR
jgi:C-terminal processing protease CtpA/Prc